MLEAHFCGKLLPAHPDIMVSLQDIRSAYDISEINPTRHSACCVIPKRSLAELDSQRGRLPAMCQVTKLI